MIYLDNASTTPIYKEVNEKIYKINEQMFYNPSALYGKAIETSNELYSAKQKLAGFLNITEKNLIFTSGATESNNMAIFGLRTGKKDAEYVFSSGEHPSVYAVANALKNTGAIVKFVSLNPDGTVDEDKLLAALTKNTHFVSLIHVSNETGAINNIEKLCKLIKQYNSKILVHVDGTQAFGKIKVDIKKLGVDSYTISAHKFHGPKGVGALYIKNLNAFKPLFFGGGQQNNYRSGTENVSGFIGMCLASEISMGSLDENYNKVKSYREYIKNQIIQNCSDFIFNESEHNSPYILSVSFKGLRGEVLLHMLEQKGVFIGVGSACSSKTQINRVLNNMGLEKQYILGSIRLSFSNQNTMEEIIEATNILIKQYKELKERML